MPGQKSREIWNHFGRLGDGNLKTNIKKWEDWNEAQSLIIKGNSFNSTNNKWVF